MNHQTSPLDWPVALKMMANEQCYRDKLFLHIGFYTAFRIGDILRLRWVDIVNTQELVILEGKSALKKVPKKRVVQLHPKLIDQIKLSFAESGDDIGWFVFRPKKTNVRRGWLDALTVNGANRIIKSIFERHGVVKKHISTHMMRKTYARRVYEHLCEKMPPGQAIEILSEMLNHSNTRTTRTYIGITQELMQQVYLSI